MRVHRRYQCEFGHEWVVRRRQGEPEAAGDAFCSEGHEAITLREMVPADEVQVLLRPAALIVDENKGQVWPTNRYYLVLLDRADQELRVSPEYYPWDRAVELAGLFRGKQIAGPGVFQEFRTARVRGTLLPVACERRSPTART